jgi:hypothetical protein
MDLFKTHIKFFIVRYQTVNGCYAHSAIPALAFHSTTVIATSVWRHAFPLFSDDSSFRRLLPAFEYLETRD